MKERLTTLMELEKLTPSRFADLIGVQRSSVSHLLSGRNKPSFDFLEKTLKAFPGLRAEWLILGSGEMFGSGVRMHDLFGDDKAENIESEGEGEITEEQEFTELTTEKEVNEGRSRKVVQVVVMYDDHTFETYRPSE